MKRILPAAAGAALALGLVSYWLPPDGVGFSPAAATKLQKTFEGSLEFSVDSIRIMVNGEEQDNPMSGDDQNGTASWTVVITDTFEAVEDGRPTELLRRFVEVSGSAEGGDGTSEQGSFDELEGKTVRFAWNDDEGVYDVSYEEGEGDDDALKVLIPDMDYRSLLPRGDVSKGDEWKVGGDDFLRVLLPGIDVRQAAESGVEIEGETIPEAFVELLDEFLKGVSVTCAYRGTSTADGVEVGEIAIKGEITGTTTIDPREFSRDEMDFDGEMEFEVAIKLPLSGMLLWDLAGGHFHSFELDGEGTVEMHMTMSIPDFGMEFDTEIEASVVLEQRASAENG